MGVKPLRPLDADRLTLVTLEGEDPPWAPCTYDLQPGAGISFDASFGLLP